MFSSFEGVFNLFEDKFVGVLGVVHQYAHSAVIYLCYSAIGGVDQALGFFFGVLRGILLVAVAFFVYDTIFAGQEFAMIDESRSAGVFAQLTGRIEAQNPEQALGWITEQYQQLVGNCGAPAE